MMSESGDEERSESMLSTTELYNKFNAFKEERVQSIRPWLGDFAKPASFSMPRVSELPSRLGHNIVFYSSNYIMLMLVFAIYMVFAQPSVLLLTLALGGLWLYSGLYMSDVQLAGRTVGFRERSAALGVLTVVLFYFFAGVGSAL